MKALSVRLVLPLVLVAALATGPPLPASSFVTFDAETLVEQASVVIEGTVISVRARWNEDRTAIHTYSKVRVDRPLVGDPPAVITVRTPGGSDGIVVVEALGFPKLQRSQRVLLFLEPGPDGSARITGNPQGAYTIVPGPDGRTMAISALRSDPPGASPEDRAANLPAVLPLADLEGRVLAIARRHGRPTHPIER